MKKISGRTMYILSFLLGLVMLSVEITAIDRIQGWYLEPLFWFVLGYLWALLVIFGVKRDGGSA